MDSSYSQLLQFEHDATIHTKQYNTESNVERLSKKVAWRVSLKIPSALEEGVSRAVSLP